jgi:hypothetical protein
MLTLADLRPCRWNLEGQPHSWLDLFVEMEGAPPSNLAEWRAVGEPGAEFFEAAAMTEVDFIRLGFVLTGDGTLRAPGGSHVTLYIGGAFCKLSIMLAPDAGGKRIECYVPRVALKISKEVNL